LKRALVTGITGQDGSYLAELLLAEGYEVHGLVRRVALEDPAHRLSRIGGILDRITLHAASLESFPSLYAAIAKVQAPACKVYFAGSSEMFGNAPHTPQNEQTPFSPRSPYGVSKLTGFHLARNYREAYGMFVCSGILFNHESPRRGFEFVTRKITSYAARIKLGQARELPLGNLEARRDWGYAPDYVRAMYQMMQQPAPEDLVIASGETHSVREFCEAAFGTLGLDYRDYVTQNPQFFRPGEIHVLQGDARLAREKLGWQPTIGFKDLVQMMVENDLAIARK
jgi:GDPmannose 4,6-dehydratase